MYSSSKNITEPEAAKPNFVLSLLAACSSAIPAAGKEGETTLSKQLSELLQDKTMVVGELNLLYTYKFGFNILDALKFIGFDGKLEDFAVQQKCFSIHDSLISLTPVDVAIQEELPAVDKPTALEDCCETASNAPTESTDEGGSDAESDIVVTGWHGVGSRLISAMIDDGCFEDDEDVDASAPAESSDEGESDAESDIDPIRGHSVGKDGCFEDDVDAHAWKVLGRRVAVALHDNHDEEAVDVDAWRDVSCRFATAFKLSSDDECCEAPSALHDNYDEEVVDTVAWRDVSCRFAAAFKRFSDDDDESCEDPSSDVSEWRAVGVNVLRCLEDSGDF